MTTRPRATASQQNPRHKAQAEARQNVAQPEPRLALHFILPEGFFA